VRAISQMIACDIHPLNNLRVMKYLEKEFGAGEPQREAWTRAWIREGFDALEVVLADSTATGTFCEGDAPTMADCCLVPQVFNGQRFDCDFSGLPRTMAAFEACMQLDAFQRAQPSHSPDAEA